MKALTLHQPWATLITLGVKTIETRSWGTDFRGPLAIHAGKTEPLSGHQYGEYEVPGLQMFHSGGTVPKLVRLTDYTDIPLPLGAIVGTCNLVDCVPVEQWHRWFSHAMNQRGLPAGWSIDSDEGEWNATLQETTSYGDFAPGRYAWLLEDIKPVEQRCPACWGRCEECAWGRDIGVPEVNAVAYVHPRCPLHNCEVCAGKGRSDPIPAKGKQGLWNWEAA
jgi:hypothetical protein